MFDAAQHHRPLSKEHSSVLGFLIGVWNLQISESDDVPFTMQSSLCQSPR